MKNTPAYNVACIGSPWNVSFGFNFLPFYICFPLPYCQWYSLPGFSLSFNESFQPLRWEYIDTRRFITPETAALCVCVCARVCVAVFCFKKKNKEETFFKVLFLCRIEVAAGTLAFYFSVRLTRFTLDLIFRFVSTRSSLARKIHFFLSLFLTDASSLSLCVSLSEHVVSRIVLLYADELDLYGNPIHPERDMFPHSLPTHTSTTCIYIYISLCVRLTSVASRIEKEKHIYITAYSDVHFLFFYLPGTTAPSNVFSSQRTNPLFYSQMKWYRFLHFIFDKSNKIHRIVGI